MTRTYKITNASIEAAGEPVLDIPHVGILRYASPQDLIEDFQRKWGMDPKSVVLPVTAPDGLLFEVAGLDNIMSSYSTNLNILDNFGACVKTFSQLGVNISLALNPKAAFLAGPTLEVVDIVGDRKPALCIGNENTQDIFGAILGTAIDIVNQEVDGLPGQLDAIIFNLYEIWSLGADNHRIEPTCFCSSCEDYLNDAEPGLLRNFRTFPNPWNLVIRQISRAAMQTISEIRNNMSAEEIVGLSRQKGFDEIFEDRSFSSLRAKAGILKQYFRARHEQTLASVGNIFGQATSGLTNSPKRILLITGDYYIWESGILFEDLDIAVQKREEGRPYDEIWFDPVSSSFDLEHVQFKTYMWRRARTSIDDFFNLMFSLSNEELRGITRAGQVSPEEGRERLRRALVRTMGSALNQRATLVSLPKLGKSDNNYMRNGFVGVSLTKEIGDKLIETLHIPDASMDVDTSATKFGRREGISLRDMLSGAPSTGEDD